MDYLEQVVRKVKPTLSPSTFKKYVSNVNTILRVKYGVNKKDYDKYYKNLDLWLNDRDELLEFINTLSSHSKKNYISTLITLLSSTNLNEKFMNELIELQREFKKNVELEHSQKLGTKDVDRLISNQDFKIFLLKLKNNQTKIQEHMMYKLLWNLPMRNEVGSLKYIKSTDFKKLNEDELNSNNYLIVSNKDIKVYRSNYKTFKTYGTIIVNIVDKKLKLALREYIKKYGFKSGDYLFNPYKSQFKGEYNVGLTSNDVSNLLGNASRAILEYALTETNIFKSVISHNMDILDNIDDKRKFLETKSKIRGTSYSELIKSYLVPKNETKSAELQS